MANLQVVVVTPERAVLDERAETVTLPMFDGELGVLPGRAALIGRLGAGELRFTTGTLTKRFFVDAGFAQIRENVVTVLTAKAIPAADVTAAAAAVAATVAAGMPAKTMIEREHRDTAVDRARGMARVAAKA
ncbi:MAG: F0F1 ATP synthase subunit epsilon [Fimbriiglobus sp.]